MVPSDFKYHPGVHTAQLSAQTDPGSCKFVIVCSHKLAKWKAVAIDQFWWEEFNIDNPVKMFPIHNNPVKDIDSLS